MWVEDEERIKWYDRRLPLSRKLKAYPGFKILYGKTDASLRTGKLEDSGKAHSKKALTLQKLYPACLLGWLQESHSDGVNYREVIYLPYDWEYRICGAYAFVDELDALATSIEE